MAETAAPTEGAAAPAVTNQAPAPGVTPEAPAPEETPIIPPEIRAIRTPATDAMEVTTLLTESEAFVGALQELSTSMEGEDGGKLVKARYLSLKAELAMMKVVSAENRQVGDKNVEALDQVVRELGNQQEKLQNMTDDIGGSLLAMSRGFTSLSEVLKGLYSKQRMEAQESENRHNRMIAAMDAHHEVFKHVRTGVNKINDSLKNTNWSLEEIRSGGKTAAAGTVDAKGGSLLATVNCNVESIVELVKETNTALCNELRVVVGEASTKITDEMKASKKRPLPAQGDDPARKVVKFFHPSTGKEHTGTLEEKAQMMTKWWGESQASGTAPSTPAPGDTTGAVPSSSAPPIPSAVSPGGEGHFIPPYGFPPSMPFGYYPPPPQMAAAMAGVPHGVPPGGMPTPNVGP